MTPSAPTGGLCRSSAACAGPVKGSEGGLQPLTLPSIPGRKGPWPWRTNRKHHGRSGDRETAEERKCWTFLHLEPHSSPGSKLRGYKESSEIHLPRWEVMKEIPLSSESATLPRPSVRLRNPLRTWGGAVVWQPVPENRFPPAWFIFLSNDVAL